MRRPRIRNAAIFVYAALCFKADAFAQLTKLNVGYVGVTSGNAAAFIARETGIYATNGLDAQLIYFNSGSSCRVPLKYFSRVTRRQYLPEPFIWCPTQRLNCRDSWWRYFVTSRKVGT